MLEMRITDLKDVLTLEGGEKCSMDFWNLLKLNTDGWYSQIWRQSQNQTHMQIVHKKQ